MEATSDREDSETLGVVPDMALGSSEATTGGRCDDADPTPGSSKVTRGSLSLPPSSHPVVLRGFHVLLLFAALPSSLCLGRSLDFRNLSARRSREAFLCGTLETSRVGAVVIISGAIVMIST